MKKLFLFIILLLPIVVTSQIEKYPVFDECKGETIENIKDCFFKQTKEVFYNEFKEPPIIENENFKGVINATFIVDNQGVFKLIFAKTPLIEHSTMLLPFLGCMETD